MALDFPSSPTNGQVYGNYTYNSSKTAWINTATSTRVVTTSDTAPSSPTNGDMWMYTVDGTCFIYYSDGTSSQWVEQSKSIITPATYQSPNFLINGAFDFWQRGTSSTTNSVYLADRWIHSRTAGTHTVSQSTDVPVTTLPYSLSFAGTSTTAAQIQQRIEAVNALPLVGQTVTLSIWAKSTVGTAALAWSTSYPTSVVDTFSALTADQSGTFAATMTVGTWTQYSATFTVSANAIRGYAVNIFRSATTTSTTTLYAGAQLELGSVVTPFRRSAPNIQGELAACQRYYIKFTATNTSSFGYGITVSSTNSYMTVTFPVSMRTAPTVGTFSTLYVSDRANYDLAVSSFSASQTYITTYSFHSNTTHASGATTSRFAHLVFGSSGGSIDFTAEL